jgi:hypothetical protein
LRRRRHLALGALRFPLSALLFTVRLRVLGIVLREREKANY